MSAIQEAAARIEAMMGYSAYDDADQSDGIHVERAEVLRVLRECQSKSVADTVLTHVTVNAEGEIIPSSPALAKIQELEASIGGLVNIVLALIQRTEGATVIEPVEIAAVDALTLRSRTTEDRIELLAVRS